MCYTMQNRKQRSEMEYKDNFYRFVEQFKKYRQPAQKRYDGDVLKHISMKMINECVKGEGKIVVFGDKDPDGVFSSMITKVYLERLMQIYRPDAFKRGMIKVDLRFSNREKDGFGLSKPTYDALSEAYSLIVTTDNGTSSGFHSHAIDNLIVIDHHPADEGEVLPKVPYIFNPNVNRTDGLEYSTSGGMVAYDVVKFIDSVLREQNRHYKAYLKDPDNHYSHTLMFEVLKEFAAFTIISDMAILDAPNRRFVLEAFKTIPMKQDKIPLYLLFNGTFTQNALSFEIIPKINIDRMGELHTINPDTGKTYMESFVRPKTYEEYKKAEKFILDIDKRRKKLVSKLAQSVKPVVTGGVLTAFIEDPEAKVGLSGLIANKLLQRYNRPAMVAIQSSDKTKLSLSGRGNSIKTLFTAILPKAGGHSDACGGSVPIKEDEGGKAAYETVCRKLEALNINIPERKTEIVNDPRSPMSFKEAVELSRLYADMSEGVELSKTIRVAVLKPKLSAFFTFKSGEWGKVKFENVEMRNNALEFPEQKIRNSEVVVFNLVANGEIGIAKLFGTVEEYLEKTVQMEEAKGFNIASETNDVAQAQLKSVQGIDILHRYERDATGDNVFYYSDFEDFKDITLSDAVIVVPSYVNDRNPHRKRSDVLEFFVGEDFYTPLDRESVAVNYKEFAMRLLALSKQKDFIFIKDGLLNHALIDDKARLVAKQIIKSVAKKEKGGMGEKEQMANNDPAYQHANAS